MRVKELQEQLSKFDPDLELMCYSEDENLLSANRGFVLFDVLAANKVEAEHTRLNDQTPYLKMGRSPTSAAIAILEVTSDF